MKQKFSHNPLPIVFLTIFIDLLGFGILIPVIPLLLADPTSPYFLLPKEFDIQQGYILLGYLLAVFPMMQFLAAPILGQLSDKFGRKRVLALSLAGTAVSYLLFAVAIITKNIPLLFIARAFDGATGGNISVAQASIADISTPQNRARNFGLVGAAFGLGFIFGPYIGGKLSDPSLVSWFDAATPFYFAAILSTLNVLGVLFILPETHKTQNKDLKINWGKSIHNIIHAYTLKNLKIPFLTVFLLNTGFTFFTTFFGVFLLTRFGFNQGNIGDFFAYIGILSAITQIFLTKRISSIFTDQQIIRVTIFGSAIGILLYFLTTESWQLFLVAPFLAFNNGLTFANITALISKNAGSEIQGEILGINASLQALGQAVPPLLSGYIAAKLSPETPLVVSSIFILASALVFLFLYKPVYQNSNKYT